MSLLPKAYSSGMNPVVQQTLLPRGAWRRLVVHGASLRAMWKRSLGLCLSRFGQDCQEHGGEQEASLRLHDTAAIFLLVAASR
mmetsp:Transcript_87914/g.155874  ORF Transcript_87914/g.155874 Transcript_87914/m.155874 type:complete len:83 (+) Transcript_87914:35-283(+)